MMFYGISLGRRYTQKQKQYFYEELCKRFRKLDYKIDLQSEASRFNSVNNIIIGDIKKAKTVIAAAYDTPSKIKFYSVDYYPFNAKKNIQTEVFYSIFQMLVSSLLFLALYFLLRNWFDYRLLVKIATGFLTVVGLLFTYWLMRTTVNPVNFNRNSAALAIIDVLARKHKAHEVAFVLLDMTVNSYKGLRLASELFPRKRVILLDSLAHGERLVLAHRPNCDVTVYLGNKDLNIQDKVYDEVQAANNQLSFLPKGLILCSGSIKKGQFVVKKTRNNKDINLDIERLEAIAKVLSEDIKKQNSKQ